MRFAEIRGRVVLDRSAAREVGEAIGELDDKGSDVSGNRLRAIVVTRPEDAATWVEQDLLDALREHFGVPVTHVVDDDALRGATRDHRRDEGRRQSLVQRFLRTIARGENPFTAFLVEFGAAVTVGTVAAVLIAIALGVWLSLR